MKKCNVMTALFTVGAMILCGVAIEASAQDNKATHPNWTPAEQAAGYVVFRYTTMENLAPSHVPARDAVATKLSCALARDEYESIQFGVHALAGDVKNIRATVESDLKVTVYHQINPADKAQLAAAPKEAREVPRWMSSEFYLQRGNVFETDGLKAGQTVNFWLTFHADEATKAGLHRGRIRIKPAARPETVLDLAVQVRPFILERPRAAFGFYYRGDRLPKRFRKGPPIGGDMVKAMYRDMAEHGSNSLWFYPGGYYLKGKCRVVNKFLPRAQKTGLVSPQVPSFMMGMDPTPASRAWLEAEGRKRNWPELIEYGSDEPLYPSDIVRDQGVYRRSSLPTTRTGTAVSQLAAAYGYSDILDVLMIRGGAATPEMQAEERRVGAELWTYSYSILRNGFLPFRQRYFAGLYTWVYEFKGNYVWAYYSKHMSHAWFEPGRDEPMPVVGHEARREGIDDYRYLQMLEDSIAANPQNKSARQAAAWLDDLRARLISALPDEIELGTLALEEYDEIRDRAAAYIAQLGPIPNEAIARVPPIPLKDPAAAYRGQSVAACIAGLESAEVSSRRGAAWALLALGRDAAPAVSALVRALDDPEVRMPALRTLETIGPAAFPAIPRVAKLLEHTDAYIRMGATLTLGEIGCPMDKREESSGHRVPSAHASLVIDPLIAGLRDNDEEIVLRAAGMLSVMGAMARPALPQAIRLLDDPAPVPREAATTLISGLGADAAQAAPKLVLLYKKKPGTTMLIKALAAIGPAASAAVPTLEKYAAKTTPGSKVADSYYALFCIRGQISDLQKMVELLKDQRVNARTKKNIVALIEKLGAKAEPVIDEMRRIVALPKGAEVIKESGFGATPAAEAHYVDGVDCKNLVDQLSLVAPLPIGGWLFKDDPKEVGVEQGYFKPSYPTNDFTKIRVDDFWDRQGYKELAEGWYRLQYECPDLPDGKRVYLYFESVDETAWLYIDGKLVAWYDSVYPSFTWQAPFLLDVTGSLKSGGKHLLAIRVGNGSGFGGVYRPLQLMVEK